MFCVPRKIGIVTSTNGAAIRDIINILKRRYPNAHIVIAPARVQGEGAAEEIISGLRALGDLDQAIRIDPQDVLAYVQRAVAYIFLGRDEEASKDVERIGELQKDPTALRAYLEVLKEQR